MSTTSKRRLNGTGTLRGILRPGFPDLAEPQRGVPRPHGASRRRDFERVAFYNYGHLRRRNLVWIAEALAVFGE